MVGFGIGLVIMGFLVGTYFGTRLESELSVEDQSADSRGTLQGEKAEPLNPLKPEPLAPPFRGPDDFGLPPLESGDSHEARERTLPPLSETAPVAKKGEHEAYNPFTVQVGAFKVRSQAASLASRLKKQGLEPFLERYEAKDGLWYRVRIGRFEDPKKAKSFLVRVRKDFPKAYIARVENESAIERAE